MFELENIFLQQIFDTLILIFKSIKNDQRLVKLELLILIEICVYYF